MKRDIMVSVIMVAYNHKKYVCQSIDSVLSQKTNFDYEILIGDDASTDGTKDLLVSKYKDNDKIRLFLRTKNVGATKNSYNLFMHANGKYLCGCECDDYWTDEYYLQTMVDWLEMHSDYAGVAARRVMLSEKTKRRMLLKTYKECNCAISIDDFVRGKNVFDACACLFVNFFHDGKSDYRTYRMARQVGDYTLVICLLQHGTVYQLDNIIGVHRMDRIRGASNYNSIATNEFNFLEHVNILKYLEKHCYPELDYSFLQSRCAYYYMRATKKGIARIKGMIFVASNISFKSFCRLVSNHVFSK